MTPRLVIAAVAMCALTVTACSDANAGRSGRSGSTPTSTTPTSTTPTSTTPTSTTPTSTTPSTPTPLPCVPRAGGRCPGPAPVDSALLGELYLASRTQLSLDGHFACGGRLRAKESRERVTITYIASRVRRGGMACADITLSVRLVAPLAGRTVIDGVSGQLLKVGVLPNS